MYYLTLDSLSYVRNEVSSLHMFCVKSKVKSGI
jgi:hypothetical protein